MALQIAVSKQPNAPLINGRGYSHQSVSIQIDGIEYKFGLVSVNYDQGLEGQPLQSTSARPVGYTLGKVSETGDIEFFSQWGKALIDQLGDGYGLRFHTIIVQKNEVGDLGGDDTQTDTIIARFKKAAQSSSGDNPLTMKFDLLVGQMKINGKDIVPRGR